jgi:hypothetical protein
MKKKKARPWYLIRVGTREVVGKSSPPEGQLPYGEVETIAMIGEPGWYAILEGSPKPYGRPWLHAMREDAERIAARIPGATVHEWSVS